MSDFEEDNYYQYINEGVKANGGFEHPKLAECISCVLPLSFSSIDTDPEYMKKRISFYKNEELTTELLKSRYLDKHKYCNILITISISGDNNVEAVYWDLFNGRTNRISTCNLSLLENGILQNDLILQHSINHDAVEYIRRRFYSDDGSLLSEEKTFYDYSSDERLLSKEKESYSGDGRLLSVEKTIYDYSSDGRLSSERKELYSGDGRLLSEESSMSRNGQSNTISPTSALQFALKDLTSEEKSQGGIKPKESELTNDEQ